MTANESPPYRIDPLSAHQYKYIMRQGTSTTWENGSNRNYTVPSSGSGTRSDFWQF